MHWCLVLCVSVMFMFTLGNAALSSAAIYFYFCLAS